MANQPQICYLLNEEHLCHSLVLHFYWNTWHACSALPPPPLWGRKGRRVSGFVIAWAVKEPCRLPSGVGTWGVQDWAVPPKYCIHREVAGDARLLSMPLEGSGLQRAQNWAFTDPRLPVVPDALWDLNNFIPDHKKCMSCHASSWMSGMAGCIVFGIQDKIPSHV